MVLPDYLIAEYLKGIHGVRYDPKQIQPCSLELTLNRTIQIVCLGEFDMRIGSPSVERMVNEEQIIEDKGYMIRPGQSFLCTTNEPILLANNMMGVIFPINSHVRMGLTVAGGLVHPGSQMHPVLSVRNTGSIPIRLRADVPICQVVLTLMQECAQWPYGGPSSRYQGDATARSAKRQVLG